MQRRCEPQPVTHLPCRDSLGLCKRQMVVRGLTEVKCLEARANKHSVGPQIISSQTKISSAHPGKEDCYQTPVRKLICGPVKEPDLSSKLFLEINHAA